MAKFEFVYCNELQKIIDIKEFIEHKENDNTSLTLLCPDEACRHNYPNTRIKACAYDKNKIFKVSPYFATSPNHKHDENCIYNLISQQIDKVISNRKKIRKMMAQEGKPIYNIIQEFSHDDSRFAYDTMVLTTQIPNHYADIIQQKKSNNSTSQTDLYTYCYTTPRRTNSLAQVVDTAKELAKHKDLGKAFIKMPRKKLCTYDKLFFSMSRLNKIENWLYVFFGRVSIFCVDNTFYISCYPIECDSIERPVIITIDPDTNTPTFMNAIKDCYKNWEYYHNEKKKFYIYIFGTPTISKIPTKLSEKYSHFKSNDDSCITFVPFAPNCMVINDFAVK